MPFVLNGGIISISQGLHYANTIERSQDQDTQK